MKTWMLTLVAGLVMTAAAAPQAQPRSERFDVVVREDLFAGFSGDAARFDRGMTACEQMLAEHPDHAEALVWHGAGIAFKAGQAFASGEAQSGAALWMRGLAEMDRAVSLAPDSVGVRIPRGATLLGASRNMPPAMARPLIEIGVADYERTLALQAESFASLGDHPKGELLFGLADGYGRLDQPAQARKYFERLVNDAAGSGHARGARQYLESGTLPAVSGLGCVGCHK